MTGNQELFDRFAGAIGNLPDRDLTRADLLTPRFLLDRDDTLSIYYAPFDYVNTSARVIIVGITPGFQQMAISYAVARELIREGRNAAEVCDGAKRSARFAGTMRANLIRMLDGIELNIRLGIPSCASLFEDENRLLQSTSAVCYPVFVNGADYTGHRPSLVRTPRLMRYARTILANEISQVPNALIIPLGKSVTEVMDALAAHGQVDLTRCLMGFPHPSGSNGHREREYQERRESLRTAVQRWFAVGARA